MERRQLAPGASGIAAGDNSEGSLAAAVERIGTASLGLLDSQISLLRLELARSLRDLLIGAGWSLFAILLAVLAWIALLLSLLELLGRWVDPAIALAGLALLNLGLALGARKLGQRHREQALEEVEP